MLLFIFIGNKIYGYPGDVFIHGERVKGVSDLAKITIFIMAVSITSIRILTLLGRHLNYFIFYFVVF